MTPEIVSPVVSVPSGRLSGQYVDWDLRRLFILITQDGKTTVYAYTIPDSWVKP